MLDALSYTIELLARALLALPFIHFGVNTLMDREGHIKIMETKNLPFPPVLMVFNVVLQMGGAFCIIFGFHITLFSLLLAAHTGLYTYLYHDFWNFDGEKRKLELFRFASYIGIIGGLLLLASMKMPLYL